MCGIAGVLHPEGARGLVAVHAMNRAQAHRGPDDEGVQGIPLTFGGLALGHTRLSIIDLSAAGHQPMRDPETENWITFNGEIYNFQDLRTLLEDRGCVFRTKTDTEVILKAYAAWGKECVKRFRGIFAFGIWDTHQRKFFLARDQLGVKPLYYYHGADRLVFASEVRAILATDLMPRAIDGKGLRSYLAYGSIQDPYTIVDGVKSLLPGHTLQWQGGNIRLDRYWQLPPPGAVGTVSGKHIDEIMADKLADAIGAQLVSDVPLGAFLSGGIDSTAIVAVMQRVSPHPVKTFSLVFKEAEYDERQYARRAAQHIGTEHTEVELTGEKMRDDLPRAITAYDQPSLDGLNTYYVSKAAKECHLTVALSGVGGDEVFGGYGGYYRSLLAEQWGPRLRAFSPLVPESLRRRVQKCVIPEVVRKAVALLDTRRDAYFVSRRLFDDGQIAAILDDEIPKTSPWEPNRYEVMEREVSGYDPINRASAYELQTYMLSTLLRDTDQMSMAHALEVRVPLIDHLLIEYLFTLPGSLKVDKRQPKPLLTRSLGGAIPEECVIRPKRGFVLPFEKWLRESLQEEMCDTFQAATGGQVWPLERPALSALWDRFQGGTVSWARVWSVFALQKWIGSHLRT